MDCKSFVFIVISITAAHFATKNTISKSSAKSGETNVYNKYDNISGMKHDFFKLISNTFITLMIFSKLPIFSMDFTESIAGRSIMAGFIIMLFHSIVQPIINMTPEW